MLQPNRIKRAVLAWVTLHCVLPWGGAFGADTADPATDPIDAAIASERMPGDRNEDAWRKPREILNFLEVTPGQHALDFYSGPGYYSELLSRVVGPTGSVLIHNNELYAQASHHD